MPLKGLAEAAAAAALAQVGKLQLSAFSEYDVQALHVPAEAAAATPLGLGEAGAADCRVMVVLDAAAASTDW